MAKSTKSLFDLNDFIKIYIDFPRISLIQRIQKRVDKMFEEGAVSEVKRFIRLKIKKSNSVNKVIGIEEILKYLNKEINLEPNKRENLHKIKTIRQKTKYMGKR